MHCKWTLALLVAAPVALNAQTNEAVLSQNAVGYVKRTIQPGDFDFVSSPFEQLDGNVPTLSQLLPDVPNNTTVFLWDEVTQRYVTAFKSFLGTWDNDPPIERGTGFFIQVSGQLTEPVELVFLGEVPGATSHAITLKALSDGPGFTIVGSPYPVSTTVADSGFNNLPNNTSLFLWNAEKQQYEIVFKNFLGSWDAPDRVIEPGQAVFVQMQAGVSSDFSQDVPYSWPDN